jgi:hypothetical protein
VDVHAGDRAQQLDQRSVRFQDGVDPVAEVGDRGVECVDVREQLSDHHAVVLDPEAAGERLAQPRLRATPQRVRLRVPLEVRTRTIDEWEKAILRSYEIWRQLRDHRGGTVHMSLTERTIEFEPA